MTCIKSQNVVRHLFRHAINTIGKVQHTKCAKEKVFNYLKKLDKDCGFEVFN